MSAAGAGVAAVTPLADGLSATAIVVAVAAIAWVLITWLGRRYVRRVERQGTAEGTVAADERAKRINTVWTLLRLIIGIALAVSVVLVLLSIWGIPTAPLVAVGSVVGVAIGFGAQNVVRDIIAGLLIIGEGQYAIGDLVQLAGVTGKVDTIRLRTTVLRDTSGDLHHVPNGLIQVATNLTREYGQVVVDIVVPSEEDLDRVTALIVDEAGVFAADEEWSSRLLSDPEMLGVEELGSSSVTLRMTFKVEPNSRWRAARAVAQDQAALRP